MRQQREVGINHTVPGTDEVLVELSGDTGMGLGWTGAGVNIAARGGTAWCRK
jgi:hypothetical protein